MRTPSGPAHGSSIAFALLLAIAGPHALPLAAQPRPADAFLAALRAHCGRAYEGRLVSTQPQDSTIARSRLVMHVRGCGDTVRIPFHVGHDRSRTWVLTRTPSGVRLKHDHRHADGVEDRVTQYGGDSRAGLTASRVEFAADSFTAALLPASAWNVWTMEVTRQRFVYQLRRTNSDRLFRVEFDLTRPVTPPPAPWGHPDSERVDSAVNARIRDEGTNRSQVLATARTLSDGFGPRLAGSPGYTAAARWAASELRRFGATRAEMEPWGRRGPAWEVTRSSVEMTAPFYLRLEALPKAWSLATDGTVRGAPVLVPSLSRAEDQREWSGRLRGRIVMLGRVGPAADQRARFTPGARRLADAELDSMARITEPGEPRTYWEDYEPWEEGLRARRAMLEWMRREGIAAIVQPSPNELTILATQYNSAISARDVNVPAFIVSREQYRRVQFLLDRGEAVTLELALATREDAADTIGVNVVADLEGSDARLKDEVVIIGGHFDAWHAAGGATDNAAGSAVAMEAMRILAAVGARPRRTIRVALWDGEEQEDYIGSAAYVRNHYADHATMRVKPDHARVSAYFNVDNGTGRIRGWRVQGNVDARPILQRFLAPWRDVGATTISIVNSGSTDHIAFTGVGIPGFNAIQDPIDYDTRTHHTGLDGAGFLVEDDLKQAAMVLASMAYHVAMRDALMPRPPLPAPRGR
jgi:carboxypeptidase Q